MNNLSETQIQIITDLLIDNGLIYEEANETVLVLLNEKFANRIDSIIRYCHQLFIDATENNADKFYILERLTKLIEAIKEYKDSYAGKEIIFKELEHMQYVTMNSFLDKTIETMFDFLKTL